MSDHSDEIRVDSPLHALPPDAYYAEFVQGLYTLIPVSNRSNVSRGDSFSVRLNTTGYGIIRISKLFITLSAEDVLTANELADDELISDDPESSNEEDSESFASTTPLDYDSELVNKAFDERKIPGRAHIKEFAPGEREEIEHRDRFMRRVDPSSVSPITLDLPIVTPGTLMYPGPSFFSDVPGGPSGPAGTFNPLMGEGNFGSGAPDVTGSPVVQLDFNVSEDATPGDHSIVFVLTYDSGIGLRQDRQELTIHVNSFYEDHRLKFQAAAVFLSVVIAGTGVLTLLMAL